MKEVNLLKGALKKRLKITESLIIFFLITGSISYAEEIDNNNLIVGGVERDNSVLTVNNNGLILGTNDENIIANSGNGISNFRVNGSPYTSDIEVNIENTGTIKGNHSQNKNILLTNPVTNLGNGVSAHSRNNLSINSNLNFLKNSGAIIGNLNKKTEDFNNIYTFTSGNGVVSYTSLGNSSLTNLSNTGIISGSSSDSQLSATTTSFLRSTITGNGVASFGEESNLTNLQNIGKISGESKVENLSSSTTTTYGVGNGIVNYPQTGEMNNINNTGIVSGVLEMSGPGEQKPIYSGNGIANMDRVQLGDVTNEGVIKGKLVISPLSSTVTNNSSGHGIAYGSQTSGTSIINKGIILGSESAIKGTSGNVENHGILAGQTIISSGITLNNTGIKVKLDNNLAVTSIENGSAGIIDGKTILNGNIVGNDSSTSALANGSNYDNYIINGAGIDKGALIIDENTELTNSIINGYNTATYIESGKTLNATDTTFNGGGLKNDVAVIKGDDGNNKLNVLGNTIINGIIDLGDGDDTLAIANTIQINGNVNGGLGNDILNLGEVSTIQTTPNINIFHEINGFESINTNGNITLFETAKIVGADNINLKSGSVVLRVDPTIEENGKVTGHALFENNGTLTSSGGNLILGLNGLGKGTTISMGGTTIIPSQNNDNDLWWKEGNFITTNSSVLDGKLLENGDIEISIFESIPLEPSIPTPPVDPPVEPPIVVDSFLYEKLNKVYQSIVSAGEIGNLANTTLLEDKTYNESIGGLLTILDQIYTNNPYAYTLKSSRDSLKLFEDNLSYLTIKPKKGEMIVQGKAIYTGVKNDSSASGKNYYGFDTGHRNYKTTTNTVGGLVTFEYGLSDDTSVGFVFGGNNQDVKFKGSSKIKGNSLYLGTFAKTDIKNFKFMSGVGYQYTSADADRKVSNRYNSFSTGDKYDINSLNAFVEAKYIYNVEQDWTVEPKVRLSYYYIDQDKVNEGYTPGQISMKTDKVNSNTADVEIGVDFVKSLYLNNGKLKNILSLGVINTIGDKSKELNGYILGKEKDGTKFDIQGVELPKTSGKVSYNLELEQTNGMIYTAGISLEFAKDYNRNINATVGIGYKF